MALLTSHADIMKEYQKSLERITYTSNFSGKSEPFLPEDELRVFWHTEDRLYKFFERMDLNLQPKVIDYLETSVVKLISILIWIGYPTWNTFKELYCLETRPPQRLTDEDLPIKEMYFLKTGPRQQLTEEELPIKDVYSSGTEPGEPLTEEDSPIKSSIRFEVTLTQLFSDDHKDPLISTFLSCQHIFAPLCFVEGEYQYSSLDMRIPIIQADAQISGEGAGGTVSAVYVPAGCLQTKNLHNKYIDSAVLNSSQGDAWQDRLPPHKLACKRIRRDQYEDMGNRELNNLAMLNKSHVKHLNIARSISAASLGITKEIVLIFEPAICDLQQFLLGEKATQFRSWILSDLLEQMYWIGDALNFLHETLCRHLDVAHGPKAFCHLDIKPANILVYSAENREPAGIWKLADFGISGEFQLNEMPKSSPTAIPKGAVMPFTGRFCAPEIAHGLEAGRLADIWSLGCILFLVKVLGNSFVRRNGQSDRQSGFKAVKDMYGMDGTLGMSTHGKNDAPDDYFYRREEGSKPLSGQLNPHITNWVEKDSVSNNGLSNTALLRLIKNMLVVNPRNRITTQEYLRQLLLVQNARREEDHNRWRLDIARKIGLPMSERRVLREDGA